MSLENVIFNQEMLIQNKNFIFSLKQHFSTIMTNFAFIVMSIQNDSVKFLK